MTTYDDNNESESRPPELPLQAQVVENGEPVEAVEEDSGSFITEPSKLIRIASMTRAMLDEVRQAGLDEAGRGRLAEIYANSLEQLHDSLSDDLQEELQSIFQPLHKEETSESELRIVQAQLVGWLEGLFHGIQASLFSQQAAAAAQLDEMRRRRALEAASDEAMGSPGQYL
ncbi:MAG: DUF2587 domain-containing protein [Acidimicrobiia bacterium]|nr:DUF2587 domain-containing protein [Acidimicrobiia bacterium]